MTPGGDAGRRPSGLSRRRLLAGIGGVGAVGMASGLGTGAYLSDRETFADNVFGAGEVGLTVDGDPTSGTVTVGPLAVDRTTFDDRPAPETFEVGASANPVRVWLATECPDGDRLGNALEVEVVVDGASVTDGYRPLAEVERDLATGVRIDAGCLDPDGGPIVVEVAPYLPADSPDVGGETTDLVFRLYAEQCRHVSEEQANAPGANPFAGVVCEQTCVPCEDENGVKVGSLSLRYLGDDSATVVVVATGGGAGGVGNGGTTVFDGEVAPNGTFVVDGADAGTNTPGWIGPNIYVNDGAGGESEAPETAGSSGNNGNGNNGNGNNGKGGSGRGGGEKPEGVNIHTSCSVPLRVGDVYGGLYEIVAAATTDGEPLCGTEAN
jgi:predicted ribosomally synthesized peptide with SipW-like signal peptide